MSSKSIKERFWSHVEKTHTCWLWLGHIREDGYGTLWVEGRNLRAHRLSWELSGRRFRRGLDVLHRCDNRRCVRPSHLFLGSDLDNARDREAKGRGGDRRVIGVKHGRAKVNETIVRRLRDLRAHSELSYEQIAKLTGLRKSHVYRICTKRSWAHV